DARRVVTAIFESLQSLEEQRLRSPVPDVSDDPAHPEPPSSAGTFTGFPSKPPENAESPALAAELSSHESRDASTGFVGQFTIFGLRENPDQRFSARGPDKDPAVPVPDLIEALDLVDQARRELSLPDRDVRLCLWPARHHGRRLAQLPPAE